MNKANFCRVVLHKRYFLTYKVKSRLKVFEGLLLRLLKREKERNKGNKSQQHVHFEKKDTEEGEEHFWREKMFPSERARARCRCRRDSGKGQ